MFPGLTTKLSEEVLASATTINPTKDLVRITGAAAIVNIIPHFGGGFSGVVFLVADTGSAFTWTAAGNIAIASAAAATVGRTYPFFFSKTTGKWYPALVL